jgi:septum formation topological specificity factor MinE
MKVSDEVMDMMQNDIRELIERYLGASIDESDMVIEISKPQFMTPVKKKLIEPTESEL